MAESAVAAGLPDVSGDYLAAKEECDVIMKGGATSGLVYPKVILRLARRYRFRSIGGASAGAVAAAITAAAEYGRATGGFGTIEALATDINSRLPTLFAPADEARGVFRVVRLGALEGRYFAAAGAALLTAWPGVVGGIIVGVGIGLVGAALDGAWSSVAIGIVLGLLLGVMLAAALLVKKTWDLLCDFDFGLAPGHSDAEGSSAVSDWLAETIEAAAGRSRQNMNECRPLTFNDLWNAYEIDREREDERAIDLRIMTTNLSMRRPHVLPELGEKNYYFRADEFARILPGWVVDDMVKHSPKTRIRQGLAYHQFPAAPDLPIVVAARMSLSFPFMISAVPLYRFDYPFIGLTDPPTRILFSDGGISSNFPIHFFDAILPCRPTFGVALDAYRDPKKSKGDNRVRLPMRADRGHWIDIGTIRNPVAFLMSIINSAKDWQDLLQSRLPGYRERIVHVHLKDDEGGLNLGMPDEKITELVEFGDRAGTLLAGQPNQKADESPFDMDDHRWRRFLVAFARLEETLCQTSGRWRGSATMPSYRTFVKSVIAKPKSYGDSTEEWRREVYDRFDALIELRC